MIITRKSIHGFPLVSYMGMGLHLVALLAARAPLLICVVIFAFLKVFQDYSGSQSFILVKTHNFNFPHLSTNSYSCLLKTARNLLEQTWDAQLSALVFAK